MNIGGFQKFSLIDYPGKVGATLFTQGCNFLCPYCHNPELVDPCLFSAPLSEAGILSFLARRRDKLEALTITGGEPTLQGDLLLFLRQVKRMGYLVKIDTNGSQPRVLEQLLGERLVDYVAMDIKAPLAKYAAVTRTREMGNKVQESIEIVMTSGIEYEFRTTVVRSQLTAADLLAIGTLIQDARLYALQRYLPSKPLDKDFLRETTFNAEELGAVGVILKKNIKRVMIR